MGACVICSLSPGLFYPLARPIAQSHSGGEGAAQRKKSRAWSWTPRLPASLDFPSCFWIGHQAFWCPVHVFQPLGLLLWLHLTQSWLLSFFKSRPTDPPDSKGTISSIMLLLEEAQLQGGRMSPPTLLGCFVLLIFCVSSFFPFSVITTSVQPKCSKEGLPSGGQTVYYRPEAAYRR